LIRGRPSRQGGGAERRRRGRATNLLVLLCAAGWTVAVAWAGPDADESGDEGASDEVEAVLGADTSPAPDAVHFDHAAHRDTACTECHGADDSLGGIARRPAMETCAECHGPAAEGESPSPELRNCSGCHVGYDRTVREAVESPEDWRSVSPAPMVPPPSRPESAFDHDVHLAALREEEDSTDDREELCTNCHGERQPEIRDDSGCSGCHAEPSGSIEPANHTVDWVRRHGAVARTNPENCEECHTEDDCTSCHDSQSARPFSVHPPNFDTLHAADARADLDNCTDCHTVATFCRRCHAETKFLPEAPDRPPAGFDVHPDGWTQPDNPNNHAVMARRNIEDCASCHTERDCVSCHQGVNPHPPEFQLRCEQWLEANPAPCAKCHGDLSSLRRKCL